jgi:hypothetical protein
MTALLSASIDTNAYAILVKSPLKGHPWALSKVNFT